MRLPALTERERLIVLIVGRTQPTTYKELAAAADLRSASSIVTYVRHLNRLGLLAADRSKSRTIRLQPDILILTGGRIGKWFPLTPDRMAG